jgi:hypothetical protein
LGMWPVRPRTCHLSAACSVSFQLETSRNYRRKLLFKQLLMARVPECISADRKTKVRKARWVCMFTKESAKIGLYHICSQFNTSMLHACICSEVTEVYYVEMKFIQLCTCIERYGFIKSNINLILFVQNTWLLSNASLHVTWVQKIRTYYWKTDEYIYITEQ